MPVGVSRAACLSVWARGDEAMIVAAVQAEPLGVLLLKRRSTRLRDAAARPRIEISDEWWQRLLVPSKPRRVLAFDARLAAVIGRAVECVTANLTTNAATFGRFTCDLSCSVRVLRASPGSARSVHPPADAV